MNWVAATGGTVPRGAVVGGNNKSGDIFVARAKCDGEFIPGKLIPEYGYCYITNEQGEEVKTKSYEVLCDDDVEWTHVDDVQGDDDIPDNAVSGGVDTSGQQIYIGRVKHGRSVTVGKVDGSSGICYVLYGNKEHKYRDYEILVDPNRTRSANNSSAISSITSKMYSMFRGNTTKGGKGILDPPSRPGSSRNGSSSSSVDILKPPAPPSAKSPASGAKSGSRGSLVEGTKLIPLTSADKEYTWLEDKMKKGSSVNYTIVKIERIWNSATWKRYQHYRDLVIKVENNGDANEKRLFHGSKSCQQIVNGGFDERVSSQGGFFGAGVYFADVADKSNSYVGSGVNGQYQMLVCRVALGKVHDVPSGSTKFSHAPPGFHSVKGKPMQHTEYIVYRGEQAFPGFLITYTR